MIEVPLYQVLTLLATTLAPLLYVEQMSHGMHHRNSVSHARSLDAAKSSQLLFVLHRCYLFLQEDSSAWRASLKLVPHSFLICPTQT